MIDARLPGRHERGGLLAEYTVECSILKVYGLR